MAESHASFRRQSRSSHAAKVRAFGGRIDAGDRAAVHKHERAMHKGKPLTKLKTGGRVDGKKSPHGSHRPKRRDEGGRVTDPAAEARDKRDNYGSGHLKKEVHARGGKAGGSKGGGGKASHVNVIVGGHPPMTPPPAAPAPMAAPPRPPMAPPPMAPMAGAPAGGQAPMAVPPRPPVMPGGPPPGGIPPMGGMGMRKRGGAVFKRGGKVEYEAGAATGEGRLEKVANYGARADIGEGSNIVRADDENKKNTKDFENKPAGKGQRP